LKITAEKAITKRNLDTCIWNWNWSWFECTDAESCYWTESAWKLGSKLL